MTQTEHRALIVVDMQNAFIDPELRYSVRGAGAVLGAVNARVAVAVERGWPVFYTRDVEPSDLPPGDPWSEAALHAGLDVRGTVIDKGPGKDGGYSGFVLRDNDSDDGGPGRGGLSGLAEHLRTAQVTHVEVVGLAGDVCVAATARDARRLGFGVTLALSATALVHAHPGGDDAALADLAAAGVTVVDDHPRG